MYVLRLFIQKAEKIYLAANKITNRGAQLLADVLRQSSVIVSLDLRVNLIGDEGAIHLAKAFKDNQVIMN